MMFQLIYAIVALALGVAAYRLALRRDRSPWGRMVASVLFIVPALVLAFLPRKEASAA